MFMIMIVFIQSLHPTTLNCITKDRSKIFNFIKKTLACFKHVHVWNMNMNIKNVHIYC